MEVNNKYIRFDWAVKRMLRDKANFAVLEGLITVLLARKSRYPKFGKAKATRKAHLTSSTA